MISLPDHSRPLGGQSLRIHALKKHSKKTLIVMASVVMLIGTALWSMPRQQGFTTPQNFAATLNDGFTSGWELSAIPLNVDLFTIVNNQVKNGSHYILSAYDQKAYKDIFAAQAKGDWQRANALLRRVHNPILKGHVLFDRYIRADNYRAGYDELRAWMIAYGDHPDAYKVYQLAQRRRQNDPAALPAPQMAKKLLGAMELNWFNTQTSKQIALKPANRNDNQVRQLMRQIKADLSRDDVTKAYDRLGKDPSAKMLSALEYDSLLSEIAAAYYYNGKYDVAKNVARQATKRSMNAVPIAHWIAGLSAWQLQDYRLAARHFHTVTRAYSRNPWMLSAGAYWAARANEKLGQRYQARRYLTEAASYERTFYGLIAQARLGKDSSFSWETPELTADLLHDLQNTPSGARALALMDIGKTDLAEKELGQIHPDGSKNLEKALVAAAKTFDMPKLALQLGNAVNQGDGKLYDAALYPVIPYVGDTSAQIEPALINALIRQESKFDPTARSSAGASGLMQLMPSTAKYISNKTGFNVADLHKPEVNVALGQRYVRHLLDLKHVDGNLLYLAAAYNAGPGNLARWQKKLGDIEDPLLFIESIPVSETRAFIERVMTNYWIYNQRFDQEATSLDALSRDEWPIYQDTTTEVTMAVF